MTISSTELQIGPPSGDPSDGGLVLAAQAGDRAALAALYRKYAPIVHGVLLTKLGREDAEDLTQEVFLKAMSVIGDLREPMAFGAWLLVAARRRATDLARSDSAARSRAITAAKPESQPAPGGFDPEDVLVAIRELPEAYRETLILRLVEGLPGPVIADRTGMTHGSVRTNLTRGMQLLREKLGIETGSQTASRSSEVKR